MENNTLNLSKYMGVWYEIARIPYEHENGLYNCKAEYTLKRKHVSVMNSGIYESNHKKYTWAAKLKQLPNVDNVFILEGEDNKKSMYRIMFVSEDYKYSIVSNGKDLVWVLSRDKTICNDVYENLLCIIQTYGYDSKKLVQTKQI